MATVTPLVCDGDWHDVYVELVRRTGTEATVLVADERPKKPHNKPHRAQRKNGEKKRGNPRMGC